MSVVAAKVYPDHIEVASDSFCTMSHNQMIKDKNSQKIFKYTCSDDYFILGSVGDFYDKFLFQDYMVHFHRKGRSLSLDKRSDLFFFLNTYREFKSKYNSNSDESSTFVIACNAGLFTYNTSTYELLHFKNSVAIGAGSESAGAALYLGKSPRKAVETAIACTTFCEGTIQSKTYKNND